MQHTLPTHFMFQERTIKGGKHVLHPSTIHTTLCKTQALKHYKPTHAYILSTRSDLRKISVVDRQKLSPGNIVGRTRRDAGFNGVCAVHAHRVEGLVVAEPKGIEVDVGLGCCPGGRLTWKRNTTGGLNSLSHGRLIIPKHNLYLTPSYHLGQQSAREDSNLDQNVPPL